MNNDDDDPAPYTRTDILSIQMLTLLSRRVLPTPCWMDLDPAARIGLVG